MPGPPQETPYGQYTHISQRFFIIFASPYGPKGPPRGPPCSRVRAPRAPPRPPRELPRPPRVPKGPPGPPKTPLGRNIGPQFRSGFEEKYIASHGGHSIFLSELSILSRTRSKSWRPSRDPPGPQGGRGRAFIFCYTSPVILIAFRECGCGSRFEPVYVSPNLT